MTTTVSERGYIHMNGGIITIENSPSIFGISLIYCLGNYLPYNTIKKYEYEENIKFVVHITEMEKEYIKKYIDSVVVFNNFIKKMIQIKFCRILMKCVMTSKNDIILHKYR